MLLKLTIENYALIDRLEIDFTNGFSVITGETGAGKSILLGALALLLGQRADTNILLDKTKKCIVEGVFHTSGYDLGDFFCSNELDQDEDTILRREINASGKSRAFINDTPVNLPLLKELGDRLVNIHSQHAITTLNDTDFQLAVIDSYADNHSLLKDFYQKFILFKSNLKELHDLIQKENKAQSELDYHQFLFDELNEAQLNKDEQEETEQRLKLLSHSEEIKSNLLKVLQLLAEGDKNVIDELSSAVLSLQQLSEWQPSIKESYERLQSNFIDIRDVASELEHIEQKVIFDPAEIEQLTARLDVVYHLQRKHNVKTIPELIHTQEDLSAKISESESISEQIILVRKQVDNLKTELSNLSESLTDKRISVCIDIESRIVDLLSKLGMPHAGFKVSISEKLDFGADGKDNVRFLFSANKGTTMSDVAKIASGGELSRLMLSVKSLISQKNLLPTIIFDEIDNGVSGEVAGKVGHILHTMGNSMQVIAITHLPQIAGQGKTHYQVFKNNEEGVSRTHIKKLSREERITEIAKMLSNEKVTDAALNTAKELLLN